MVDTQLVSGVVSENRFMKSTKSYSTGLKELRLKLGIKPPLAQTRTDERAAEIRHRVYEVFQKSRKRSELATRTMKGPQYRWTPEEDQKLMRLRASGLEWSSIAKKLHRTERGVAQRFRRLLEKPPWP